MKFLIQYCLYLHMEDICNILAIRIPKQLLEVMWYASFEKYFSNVTGLFYWYQPPQIWWVNAKMI